MSNFWDLIWLMFSGFLFVSYLIIMFQIIVDLFRDSELGGFAKILWIAGLILVPVLTAIIYILARGRGMAERQVAQVQKSRAEAETFIKGVAGTSPAAQIADAKALLDAGTINQDEFAKLKAKALS
jgi:Phospholipase_D-nuclease N-terminal